MIQQARGPRVHERWAHLRFSVIGQLLAAPPPKGELRAEIEALAGRQWRRPITGDPARFGFSTIERWYYRALKERSDPVGVLRRKLRTDAGQQPAMSDAVRQAVLAQYAAHKSWSVQLHHDNLVALAETRSDLKPAPSYATLRRFLKANGLDKRRRVTSRQTAGADRAEARLFDREVRSYEAAYVNGLWHWDCHHGSRKVLTARGEWQIPILFGVLDDRSRLACHLQWYLAESAETIAHGLSQAFQKRGLPRSALSDNGAAMTAAEITEGLTPPRHPAPDHAALQPLPERQAGGVLGSGRRPADRHAGTPARSHALLPQRGDAGLGRVRVQPQGPLRDRRSPSHALPRGSGGDTAQPRQRHAAPRLHPHRSPHAAQERWDRRHRGAPFRGAEPLPPSLPRRGPLRRLGSRPRPPRRRAHRQGAVPALSPGQDRERQRPAPSPRSGLARAHDVKPATGIAPLLARLLDRQAATGLPPPYLPKDEQGDDT